MAERRVHAAMMILSGDPVLKSAGKNIVPVKIVKILRLTEEYVAVFVDVDFDILFYVSAPEFFRT